MTWDILVYVLPPALLILYIVLILYIRRVEKSILEAFISDKMFLLERLLPILSQYIETVCATSGYNNACTKLKSLYEALSIWYEVNKSVAGMPASKVRHMLKGG